MRLVVWPLWWRDSEANSFWQMFGPKMFWLLQMPADATLQNKVPTMCGRKLGIPSPSETNPVGCHGTSSGFLPSYEDGHSGVILGEIPVWHFSGSWCEALLDFAGHNMRPVKHKCFSTREP